MRDDHHPSPPVSDLEKHRAQAWERAEVAKARMKAKNARVIGQASAALNALQRTVEQQRAAQQDPPTGGEFPPA